MYLIVVYTKILFRAIVRLCFWGFFLNYRYARHSDILRMVGVMIIKVFKD